jgi:hypothetical protein
MASRIYKMSANKYTVIFVRSLIFGATMSFQHNNTNSNETETSRQKTKSVKRPQYINFTFNCHIRSSGITGMKMVIGEDRFCDGSNCLRLP